MKNTINKNDIQTRIEQTYLNESYLSEHERKNLRQNTCYVENPEQYRIYPFLKEEKNPQTGENIRSLQFKTKPKASETLTRSIETYPSATEGVYKFVMTGLIDENGMPKGVKYYADPEDYGRKRDTGENRYVKNHNDFIHGQAVLLAGALALNKAGGLMWISNESGHYRVTLEHFLAVSKYFIEVVNSDRLRLHDYSRANEKPAAYYAINLINDDFFTNESTSSQKIDMQVTANLENNEQNQDSACYETIFTSEPVLNETLNIYEIGEKIQIRGPSRVQNGIPLHHSIETDDLKLLSMVSNKLHDEIKATSHNFISHLLTQNPVLKPTTPKMRKLKESTYKETTFSIHNAKEHLRKLTLPRLSFDKNIYVKSEKSLPTKGLSLSSINSPIHKDLNKYVGASYSSENTDTNLVIKQ
jgi:hypothetical protein